MIKKIIKFCLELIRNLNLKNKLLLSFFILILIPLATYSSFVFSRTSDIVESHVIYSATRAFDQAASYLEYKINKVIKVANVVAVNNTVHEILEKQAKAYNAPEQYKDMNNLKEYLDSHKDGADVYSVKLYVNDEFIFASNNESILSISKAKGTNWHDKLLKSDSSYIMCPQQYFKKKMGEDERIHSVVKKIVSSDNYADYIGLVRVDFKDDSIHDIITNANTVQNSVSFILDSEGIIVSVSDYSLFQKLNLDSSLGDKLSDNKDWSIINFSGKDVYVKSSKIKGTDWQLITAIPYEEIFADSKKLGNILFAFMLVIGAIAYIIACFITYSVTKRISQLIKRMKVVQSGSLDVIMESSSKDEIGELVENFNYMVKRISILIEEQYKSGQELKGSELKALQAQINPHFLYNTLDLINWMSLDNKGAEIRTLVKALSMFYKLSLNKGKDIVTIKDELDHVSFFIQIQNIRLNNKIDFSINVDDLIRKYSILKITLQPIVENSILHGIMEKEVKQGTITINGYMENDVVVISVEDDGVGIPRENIPYILDNDIEYTSGSGFGIKNINQRIKLYFGKQYGLSFYSEYGKGTTVTIRIPAIERFNN